MSKEINPSSILIRRAPLPDLQQKQTSKQQPAVEKKQGPDTQELQFSNFLRSMLRKLSASREHEDDKSFKAFTKLSRNLEQMFEAAENVNREDGLKELKLGGMWRIDKDMRKLFKGLGMPAQLASHFSREITAAMQNIDIEQVSYPLKSSRSFNLEARQQQSGYLASGAVKKLAASHGNSFRLAAIQARSVDISINLRSGDYYLSQSRDGAFSVNHSSTATLDQINRTVKQSAIVKMSPAINSDVAAGENTSTAGASKLQQLVERLAEVAEATEDMFETLVQIRDLRVENEESDNHLRFTTDAQAPIGLTAVDGQGRGTTIYPRPDGSLGKMSDTEVKLTV